jgi:SAM-dependent methyltransferase
MEQDQLEHYRRFGHRYAEVVHDFLGSDYRDPSPPQLTGDVVLLERFQSLAPGKKGLDAGCGAGARDVYLLHTRGYDMHGVDALQDNLDVAAELHPEIADRLEVADLSQPLRFPDASFDFVACNAVIQHISPELVKGVTLPELIRVLRPGGVLQLMFKSGKGIGTVLDPDYDVQRSFQLYDEHEILAVVERHGCSLIAAEGDDGLGGLMFFTDYKPMRHCVFHARRAQ